MPKCVKCGEERVERGLNSLTPCPNCGATLQEEIAIAKKQVLEMEKQESFTQGIAKAKEELTNILNVKIHERFVKEVRPEHTQAERCCLKGSIVRDLVTEWLNE